MLLANLLILAQRSRQAEWLSQTLLWLGILGLGVIVGGFVLMVLRKRLHDTHSRPGDPPFTLSDLRRLHRSGQLSDEEYERAKQQIIALSTGDWSTDAPDQAPQAGRSDDYRISEDDLADSDDKPE